MATELWRELSELLLVATAALLLIALLRKSVRQHFGARVAYALWLALPLAALATLLPAPAAPVITGGTLGSVANLGNAGVGIEHTRAFDPLPWLLLWAGGVVLSLLWMLQRQRRFQRELGQLQPAADGSHRSRHATAPALVGLLRPRIVLPSDFEQRYSPDEQALVLAHERAHLHHFDAWANAAAALALCLLWLHPLAWWALGRFRFDQELACDARVLEATPQSRRAYADALLKTQLHADAAWRLPLGCHWQSSHPLKERVAMLKAVSLDRPYRVAGKAAVLTLCSAIALAAWAMQTPAAGELQVVDATAHTEPSEQERGNSSIMMDIVGAENRRPDDPQLSHLSPPKYPASALREGLGGQVLLHVQVKADGSTGEIRVQRSSGHESLDRAAVSAASTWRFNPGHKDGRAIGGWVQVPVTFEPDSAKPGTPAGG